MRMGQCQSMVSGERERKRTHLGLAGLGLRLVVKSELNTPDGLHMHRWASGERAPLQTPTTEPENKAGTAIRLRWGLRATNPLAITLPCTSSAAATALASSMTPGAYPGSSAIALYSKL